MPDNSQKPTKNICSDATFLLQMVFLYLKLTGKIDWSWEIVFIPTWIGIGVLFIIIVLTIAIETGEIIRKH